MIFCLIFTVILCLYKIKFASQKNSGALNGFFCTDYLSVDKTNSIKGLFIILVFFSHISGYLSLSEIFINRIYFIFNYGIMGQGIVAVFFFYSGYAMMLSGVKKGREYVKTIPCKRVLRVLLHFDIAVLIFLLVQTALGERFSLSQILLSFICIKSLGNSNWYIFAILIMYLITFISFLIGKKNQKRVLAVSFILTLAYCLIISRFMNSIWYDTVFLYPLGMLWFTCKDKIEQFFVNKKYIYYVVLGFVVAIFAVTIPFRDITVVTIFKNALFGIIVILLTMKVQVHNKVLCFFGRHLFSLYILQRIPMLVFEHFGLNEYPAAYIIVCAAATVPIAVGFDFLLSKLDGALFKPKKALNLN